MKLMSRGQRSDAPRATSGARTDESEERRIHVEHLCKSFVRENGTRVPAVDDLSLSVAAGEFLVLLGPSGCGKTTLLRLIAGLETPDSGMISLDGAAVYDSARKVDVPPERRLAGMVFQSYALWPHMSVFENVAYPLRSARVRRAEVRQRTRAVLEKVGVGQLEGQYPGQLSGGQQQRVALARAIVAERRVILFDEPLSNVDAKVRDQLRIEILRMQRELGFTALYVTHDQEEAMTLGTRIAVLRDGEIAQLGAPREIYDAPCSPYVASFIGVVDQFRARVVERGANFAIAEGRSGQRWRVRVKREIAKDVVVMARPERWRLLDRVADESDNLITGIVEASVYLGGSRMEYVIRTEEGLVRAHVAGGADLRRDTRVTLTQDSGDLLIFDADG